jgi:hypothetical protein
MNLLFVKKSLIVEIICVNYFAFVLTTVISAVV